MKSIAFARMKKVQSDDKEMPTNWSEIMDPKTIITDGNASNMKPKKPIDDIARSFRHCWMSASSIYRS